MYWESLIAPQRSSSDDEALKRLEHHKPDAAVDAIFIHPHQADVDRILYSSAFRRLQGKAQVFSFPETDYYRTRLTHTLEVSNIGRLLATSVFRAFEALDTPIVKSLFEDAKKLRTETKDLIDAVAAACLAHDIGNPPFGHIGEYAIRSWFQDRLKDKSRLYLSKLGESEEHKQRRNDFLFYDGNAQGFRILTRLQGWGAKGGLELTYTTLGSFMKYPWGSDRSTDKNPKFGYFLAEARAFERATDALKLLRERNGGDEISLKTCRHPFAYLVEAADDIAYRGTDIEDGIKAGLIPFREGRELLHKLGTFSQASMGRYREIKNDTQDQIKFLRSGTTLKLVRECAKTFVENIDEIMAGEFHGSLLSRCNASAFEAASKKMLVDYVYYEPRKVRQESGAYEIVRYLLDVFSEVIESYIDKGNKFEKLNDRDRNLYYILSRDKGDVIEKVLLDEETPAQRSPEMTYHLYLIVVDFISGMSDSYARQLYRSIGGHSMGGP